MPLQPGTTLGAFEIGGLLGIGGMGEVYRARDTKLGREVAIKVLPAEVAQDFERMQRFEREAKLLASLSHPHIATLHDFQSDGDTHFLVMELVEGETLAERIARGAVPLDEAIPLFVQIAEALEAAHEQGIVHRDLKPGNIKVTHDDKVKVLDFGIAKSMAGPDPVSGLTPTPTPSSPDATTLAATPTPPSSITGADMLVGTPSYMSPEQARGRRVDKRADIWAFGCCLYEALTGVKTFSGESVADSIGSIARDDADLDLLPGKTPPEIKGVLLRCLRKDPARRLRDIGDARIELQEAMAPSVRESSAADAPAASARARWQGAALGALVTAVLAIVAVPLVQQTMGTAPAPDGFELDAASPAEPRPLRRYSINLPKSLPLRARGPVTRLNMNISPDGTRVVYVSDGGDVPQQLVTRRLDQQTAEPMYGTEGAESPFFSPDGQWVGFFVPAQRLLKKISIQGGSPVPLCSATSAFGGTWGDDGNIYFQSEVSGGLRRVPDGGGEAEVVTTVDTEAGQIFHVYPTALPGSKALLFVIGAGPDINMARTALLNLETGEIDILLDRGAPVGYAGTGHVLCVQAGMLTALPFDLDTLAVNGPPVPITDDRMAELGEMPRDVRFSRDGTMVFVPTGAESEANRTLVWVDREGNEEPLVFEPARYNFFELSPDGTRLAVSISDSANSDIWVNDFQRGTSTRLTFYSGYDNSPVWTPDGNQIVFHSLRDGALNLYSKPADGSGPAKRLTTSTNAQFPGARAGNELLFAEIVPGTGLDIMALSIEDGGDPRAVIQTRFNESLASVSPDGRWIAYDSDEAGRFQVFVLPYPDLRGKWQVSTDGGRAPLWSPDGSELFYRNGDQMMAVAVETEATFRPGNPELLFDAPYVDDPVPANYDVSRDGQRLLMVKRGVSGDTTLPRTEIMVVENWFQELERLAPPWEDQ